MNKIKFIVPNFKSLCSLVCLRIDENHKKTEEDVLKNTFVQLLGTEKRVYLSQNGELTFYDGQIERDTGY